MKKMILFLCVGMLQHVLGYTVPSNSSSFYQSTSYSASSGIYKNGGWVYSIPGEYNASDSGVYYLGVKYVCQEHDFMYGDFSTYAVWLPQAWTGNTPSGTFILPTRINNHAVVGIGYGALKGAGITNFVCESAVIKIESQAFYGCTKLVTATFPSSITDVGKDAFRGVLFLIL